MANCCERLGYHEAKRLVRPLPGDGADATARMFCDVAKRSRREVEIRFSASFTSVNDCDRRSPALDCKRIMSKTNESSPAKTHTLNVDATTADRVIVRVSARVAAVNTWD